MLRDKVGARFLRMKKGTNSKNSNYVWFIELSAKRAREKVGHALRDMAEQQRQSSAREHWETKPTLESVKSDAIMIEDAEGVYQQQQQQQQHSEEEREEQQQQPEEQQRPTAVQPTAYSLEHDGQQIIQPTAEPIKPATIVEEEDGQQQQEEERQRKARLSASEYIREHDGDINRWASLLLAMGARAQPCR